MQYASDLPVFASVGDPSSQASIYQRHHYIYLNLIIIKKSFAKTETILAAPGLISVRRKSAAKIGQTNLFRPYHQIIAFSPTKYRKSFLNPV